MLIADSRIFSAFLFVRAFYFFWGNDEYYTPAFFLECLNNPKAQRGKIKRIHFQIKKQEVSIRGNL
jgi:hypothetical protein